MKTRKSTNLEIVQELTEGAKVLVETGEGLKRVPADELGKVKTVNGNEPGENGDVEIDIPEAFSGEWDDIKNKPFGATELPLLTCEFDKNGLTQETFDKTYYSYTPDNSIEIGKEIFEIFKNAGLSLNEPMSSPETGAVKLKATFTYDTLGETVDVVEIPISNYQVKQVGAYDYALVIQDNQFGVMPICGFIISFSNEEVIAFRYFMTNAWATGTWDTAYEFTGNYQNYGYANGTWCGRSYKFEVIITTKKKIERDYLDFPSIEQVTSASDMKPLKEYNGTLYSEYPPSATSSRFGLVKPVSKTSAMTKKVGTSNGELYTTPDIDFTPTENDNGKIVVIKGGKIAMENPKELIFLSSTEGSEKLFRITVNDNGEISATQA